MNEKGLSQIDPEVADAIRKEIVREQDSIVLIASENYASRAVIEAQCNVMTNKYAEGYPGARYYGGCEFVDIVETLAIKRAQKLFNAEYVKCSAPCRLPGQYGCLFFSPEALRYHTGNEPFPWRTSHTW